jgi:hypothetical protein
VTIHPVVVQRSPEWFALRCGRVTSSRAADFLATLKNGRDAKSRTHYRVQLALERLNGRSSESSYQADALAAYEAHTGDLVTRVGFIAHDQLLAGGSPDGLIDDIDDDGLVEVKCPLPATHLEFLKTGVVPHEYLCQMRHLTWLTEADWCDFVSFCSDFPEALRVKIVRVTMSHAERDSYELLLRGFLREIDEEVAAILALQEAQCVGS